MCGFTMLRRRSFTSATRPVTTAAITTAVPSSMVPAGTTTHGTAVTITRVIRRGVFASRTTPGTAGDSASRGPTARSDSRSRAMDMVRGGASEDIDPIRVRSSTAVIGRRISISMSTTASISAVVATDQQRVPTCMTDPRPGTVLPSGPPYRRIARRGPRATSRTTS